MTNFSSRLGGARYEADIYYQKALEAYKKHQLGDAVQNMQYAIGLVPKNAEYLAARGLFYLEDGIKDKAHADFDQALRYHAFEVLANYGKGILAYQAGDWTMSRDYFMKAWAGDNRRAETHYYIALTYHRESDNDNAKVWMTLARDLFLEDKAHQKDAEKWLEEFERLIVK